MVINVLVLELIYRFCWHKNKKKTTLYISTLFSIDNLLSVCEHHQEEVTQQSNITWYCVAAEHSMQVAISLNCCRSWVMRRSKLTCWLSSCRSSLQPTTITGALTCISKKIQQSKLFFRHSYFTPHWKLHKTTNLQILQLPEPVRTQSRIGHGFIASIC